MGTGTSQIPELRSLARPENDYQWGYSQQAGDCSVSDPIDTGNALGVDASPELYEEEAEAPGEVAALCGSLRGEHKVFVLHNSAAVI